MKDRAESRREDYRFHLKVPTRWNDNDQLGHVNNVVYHAYIEAVVVRFMNDVAGLDWMRDPVVPLAVETRCRYLRPISYPDVLDAAFRVERLGTTSVSYAIALFQEGREDPAALGDFVHVFVDRNTESPAPIPEAVREVYERFRAA